MSVMQQERTAPEAGEFGRLLAERAMRAGALPREYRMALVAFFDCAAEGDDFGAQSWALELSRVARVRRLDKKLAEDAFLHAGGAE